MSEEVQNRSKPVYIGARIYRESSFGGNHPLAIPRVPVVTDICRSLGWLANGQYRSSPRAKPQALHAFHTPDYVRALQDAEASQMVSANARERHGLGTLSNPIHPHMFRRPATSVGGVLLGAALIAKGGVAYVPGGGTHHGMPDRANGFCYFNDPVLAIQALQKQGHQRIVYVDIDAHHCDGVEAAFSGVDGVRLISVHEDNRWPFTGALTDIAGGTAFNLPIPRDLNDSEYQLILDRFILPAVTGYRPDVIVLQCGSDALLEDPLSRLALSNNCHWATVAELASTTNRFLVLGGGGYNPWSVARCWSGVWAILNGHDLPDALPAETRSILSSLTWVRKAGQRQPDAWIKTLRDPKRPGPVRDIVKNRVIHHEARLAAYRSDQIGL